MGEKREENGLLGKPLIITLFITGGIVLIIMLLKNLGVFSGLWSFIKSLQALFFGILFAYILNPITRYFEEKFLKRFSTAEKPRKKLCKGLGLAVAVLILLGVVFVLIGSIVPQLIETIRSLIQNSSSMIRSLIRWLKSLSDSEAWQEQVIPTIQDLLSDASGWLGELAGQGSDLFTAISNGILSFVKIILNLVVGLIIGVYILISKEKLIAQVRKISFALLPSRQGKAFLEIMREGNKILENYMVGKLIDSLIIGAIALVVMFLLKFPYVLLISAVICVTNMIPFFGPYIGAVFGVILILMVDPIQALYFIIFVVVLQQLDGNIIGPKILGESIGLDPLWIVVAVMAFGSTFGFLGMILGVPVFAWIYYIVKRLCEYSLARRNLPVATENYYRGKESAEIESFFPKAEELNPEHINIIKRHHSEKEKHSEEHNPQDAEKKKVHNTEDREDS